MDMKKVLVVDDEKHWMNLFRSILQDYNFEIFEAFDGKAGVEKAKQLKPELIILDNKMPGMTGLEAARVFRSEPSLKNTPILMATAMDFSESMVDYVKMDVHDFIKKPFEVKDLMEKIEKLTGPVSHKAEFEYSFSEKKKLLSCFINEENSLYMKNSIKKDRYEIINAKDSSELLEKALKENPDAIATGAANAGWSSYMGVKLLQNSLIKGIPIIMDLADSDSDELTRTVVKTGKRYFLVTPIEAGDIEKHLLKKSSGEIGLG